MNHLTKKNPVSILLLSFICCTIILVSKLQAQGDLLLYPKRLVFEGSKQSRELSLTNTGHDTARYVISLVQIRMKEDGGFETITIPDSGQHFADKNLRFFPRNVVLAPNEAQTVKIQLIKASEMLPGEYRSHIYLRSEAEKDPLGGERKTKDSVAISVHISAVFGITIPVIIKVGESDASVNISDMSFQISKDLSPSVKFKFNRSGNMSVYGDITVNHISTTGKIKKVGFVQGVAIYAPGDTRYFTIPLEKNAGLDYKTGKLSISYTTPADAKSLKIAEAAFELL